MGVSKIVKNQLAAQNTRVGTPLYLAPELVKQKPYDFKIDIWAMGCVLYQMCTLKAPFAGENLISLGYNIVHQQPPALSSCYSPELSALIFKLLEKNPLKRPNSSETLSLIEATRPQKPSVPQPAASKRPTHALDLERLVTVPHRPNPVNTRDLFEQPCLEAKTAEDRPSESKPVSPMRQQRRKVSSVKQPVKPADGSLADLRDEKRPEERLFSSQLDVKSKAQPAEAPVTLRKLDAEEKQVSGVRLHFASPREASKPELPHPSLDRSPRSEALRERKPVAVLGQAARPLQAAADLKKPPVSLEQAPAAAARPKPAVRNVQSAQAARPSSRLGSAPVQPKQVDKSRMLELMLKRATLNDPVCHMLKAKPQGLPTNPALEEKRPQPATVADLRQAEPRRDKKTTTTLPTAATEADKKEPRGHAQPPAEALNWSNSEGISHPFLDPFKQVFESPAPFRLDHKPHKKPDDDLAVDYEPKREVFRARQRPQTASAQLARPQSSALMKPSLSELLLAEQKKNYRIKTALSGKKDLPAQAPPRQDFVPRKVTINDL